MPFLSITDDVTIEDSLLPITEQLQPIKTSHMMFHVKNERIAAMFGPEAKGWPQSETLMNS